MVTHGFSLMAQGLAIPPTLILVKIMPLLNLVATIIAGRDHLIKYAYLYDDKLNICRMPQYTIGENLNPKHSITNQWWGLGL